MNHPITPIKIHVRLDRLTQNAKSGHEPAYWFGISSRRGMAIGAHLLTQSGAHIRHVPLSWLAARPDVPEPDHPTQLWECFSNQAEVVQFPFLDNYACTAYPDHAKPGIHGRLLFTIDFLPDGNPDITLCRDAEQGKLAHVIVTDAGHFIAMPTNRVVFRDGFFIGTKPAARSMGYRTMTHNEQVEYATCNHIDA